MSSVLAGTAFAAHITPKPSRPYLASIAPVPLRFAPPPPDLSTDPAPAAPPNPDGILGEVAQSNQEAVAPSPEAFFQPPAHVSPAPAPESTPAEPVQPAVEEPAPRAPSSRPPVAILPDDLPPRSSPEAILPFFLPPTLPSGQPSSATYQLR